MFADRANDVRERPGVLRGRIHARPPGYVADVSGFAPQAKSMVGVGSSALVCFVVEGCTNGHTILVHCGR